MKPIPTILAATIAVALIFSPLASFAAGTITFTSPPAGSSFKGTQSYTISGNVSPAPGVADNVFIQVKNPSGTIVDAASVPVTPSTGAFSYSTSTGGSADWVTGTYTIVASDSYGATGTMTFSYTAVAPAGPGGRILVQVQAPAVAFAGQTIQIAVLTSWANNGSLAAARFQTAHYHTPTGGLVNLGAPTTIHKGFYFWTVQLPANAAPGSYFIHVWVNNTASGTGDIEGQGLGVFTVDNQLATQSSLSSALSSLAKQISANFTSLQSSLTSAISSLSSAISSLQSTVTSIQNSLASVSGTVSGLPAKVDQAVSAANNAASSVSSTQTYVLVVAALAAITLVLELAILVRKLS